MVMLLLVQAAKNILEIAYRALELDDIQERVDQLESRLADEQI